MNIDKKPLKTLDEFVKNILEAAHFQNQLPYSINLVWHCRRCNEIMVFKEIDNHVCVKPRDLKAEKITITVGNNYGKREYLVDENMQLKEIEKPKND